MPRRCASTSSSVSKNHPWSSDQRQAASRATSARIALKPHCASLNRARSATRSSRLYAREISSRLAPARAPARRGAGATRSPGRCGPRAGARPAAAARRARSRGRRPCTRRPARRSPTTRPQRPAAALCRRGGSPRRRRVRGSAGGRPRRRSVLALSAITIRHDSGKLGAQVPRAGGGSSPRARAARCTPGSRSRRPPSRARRPARAERPGGARAPAAGATRTGLGLIGRTVRLGVRAGERDRGEHGDQGGAEGPAQEPHPVHAEQNPPPAEARSKMALREL